MNDLYQGHNPQSTSTQPGVPAAPPSLTPTQPGPPQPGQQQLEPTPSTPAGRSGRGALMTMAVITAVAVLGLVGVVGYLVVSGGDESASSQPSASDGAADDPAADNAEAESDADAEPGAGEASSDDDSYDDEPINDPAATENGQYPIPEIPMNPDLSNLTEEQKKAAETVSEQIQAIPRGRRSAITFLMSMPDTPYSEEDATAAVDALHVDWVGAAKAAAFGHLNSEGFSQQGLINYMTGDFTEEEATQAVGEMKVDWSVQAERYARSYASTIAISRSDLLSLMTDPVSGAAFEQAEAEKGIEDAKIDFMAEAVEAAQEWIDDFPDKANCGAVTHILEVSEFTPEEVTHGANEVGVC